uniref:Putative secreted salivary protein salp15 iper-1 n=1 Tax=Ixodes ricinus TaxID=34613 RepID=V5H5G5_IXORI
MKVVCIILLFVIAAEATSMEKSPAVGASNGKDKTIKLNFPPYVPNHYGFASSLLTICEKYAPKTQKTKVDSGTTYKPRINDLHVELQGMHYFFSKRDFGNVTLVLAREHTSWNQTTRHVRTKEN